MRLLHFRASLMTSLMVGCLLVSAPALAEGLLDALAHGKPQLELRLSYENSNVKDNGTDTASSMTMRTRVGYKTGEFNNSTMTFQMQDVSALIKNYAPVEPGYDKVADPEGSRMHQLFLNTQYSENFASKLGRQEIITRDARLIGNIGWRQHGQSFDALKLTGKLGDDLTFVGSYVDRVQTIFNTTANLNYLTLLDLDYTGIAGHKISAMAYLLDSLGGTPTDRDKATYSVRAEGDFGLVNYMADYVTQKKYADSDVNGGTMLRGFVNAKVGKRAKVGVGYSSLSGASGADRAFDTLFSTAHKFNGWSDQFLATNGGGLTSGLTDLYFQVAGGSNGHKMLVRYHRFDMESASGTYGTEFDVMWKKKLHKNLLGMVKLAMYSADGANTDGVGSKDETVFWVRGTYKF